MINKEFLKAVGVGALALMASASPAMAGKDAPVCAPADKAKVVNLTQQYGVPTLDFTNSSEACLKKFASRSSHKYLVYVSESDSPAWRDATVEAAKIDKKEGIPVAVAFSGDEDGDPRTADTFIWANGISRDIVPESVKKGYTVDMVVAVDPQTSIDYIHNKGHAIWDQYIKIP